MPTGHQVHIDAPLSNLAMANFQTMGGFVASQVFPVVPVEKQSNGYYILDQNTYQRVPSTYRAPKTEARRIEFKTSTDTYNAKNYALAGDNAIEDLSNADTAVRLRQNTIGIVTRGLLTDYEVRAANKAITGVSTVARMASADAWDAVSSADILTQINNAKLQIYSLTGLLPNTLVLDYRSYNYARRNALLFSKLQYATPGNGLLSTDQLKSMFELDNIFISTAIKNNARENATASITSIWGPTALVCYVPPTAESLALAAFGLSMRWTPDGMPAPFQVGLQTFAGPGTKNIEVVETGYYQDEKVTAANLGYYINTKSGTPW